MGDASRPFSRWDLVATFLMGALVPSPTLLRGYSPDEALTGYCALRIAHGAIPNVDFPLVYPGGSFWLTSIVVRLLGHSFLALRVQALLLSGAIAMLLYALARHSDLSHQAGLVASAVFSLVGVRYLWLVPYPTWHCLIATLLCTLLLQAHRTAPTPQKIALAGLCAGASLLVKQTLGVFQIAAGAATLIAFDLARQHSRPQRHVHVLLLLLFSVGGAVYARVFGAGWGHLIVALPLVVWWIVLVCAGQHGTDRFSASLREVPTSGFRPTDSAKQAFGEVSQDGLAGTRAGRWPSLLTSLVTFILFSLTPSIAALTALVVTRGAACLPLLAHRLVVMPAELFSGQTRVPISLVADRPFVFILGLLVLGKLLPFLLPSGRRTQPWTLAWPFLVLLGPCLIPGSRAETYVSIFCGQLLCFLPLTTLLIAPVLGSREICASWVAPWLGAACFYFVTIPVALPHYNVYALAPCLVPLATLVRSRACASYLGCCLMAFALAQGVVTVHQGIPNDGPTTSESTSLRLPTGAARDLDAVMRRCQAMPPTEAMLGLPWGQLGFLLGRCDAVGYGGGLNFITREERRTLVGRISVSRTPWIVLEDEHATGWRQVRYQWLVALLTTDYEHIESVGRYHVFHLRGLRR